MRTTVRLDPDIQAAVAHLRASQHISASGAINQLARQGLNRQPDRSSAFTQRTAQLGLRIDISNIGEALDLLDGANHT